MSFDGLMELCKHFEMSIGPDPTQSSHEHFYDNPILNLYFLLFKLWRSNPLKLLKKMKGNFYLKKKGNPILRRRSRYSNKEHEKYRKQIHLSVVPNHRSVPYCIRNKLIKANSTASIYDLIKNIWQVLRVGIIYSGS